MKAIRVMSLNYMLRKETCWILIKNILFMNILN